MNRDSSENRRLTRSIVLCFNYDYDSNVVSASHGLVQLSSYSMRAIELLNQCPINLLCLH